MPAFPDLSALPVEQATDGLLKHFFRVRKGRPETWERSLPVPGETRQLPDGSAAHIWGDGPAILLAHGFQGRTTQFAALADRLFAAGFRLIALDMPGHGASRALRADPFSSAKAVKAASDVFGPFQAMIGHSQGGNAVLHAAAHGAASDRLILLAPLISVGAHIRRACANVKFSKEVTDLFIAKITDLVGVPPEDFDAIALSGSLQIPALLIHDRHDREIPFTEAEGLAQAWSAATLLEMQGLGHTDLLRDQTVVNRVMTFVMA